jgi:hypothetical protein
METNNFNDDVRNGALAALDAMKIIEQIAESGNSDWTIDQCFKAQNIAVNSALLAAGDIPERAQGVIAAMAEYIYMNHSAGIPNLEQWKPESAMTAEEKNSVQADIYLS